MNASSRGGAEVYFAVMHFTAGQGTAASTAAYMHLAGWCGGAVSAVVIRAAIHWYVWRGP